MIQSSGTQSCILGYLWLIPVLPMLAAGLCALLKREQKRLSATLTIGSMGLSLVLALSAFVTALAHPARQVVNFAWMQFGTQWVRLGWLLDPLAAVMLVMVTFVGLLIFIYSLGYMAHDDNFTRFFCFLSLFAGAMLGVIISNSLLLLFMCWEVVGLTSYLLIGFWFHRPAAAAAAKKAFITTRVGDLGLLIGMVWLYAQSGTLLFYDNGAGCLEQSAVTNLGAHVTILGMAVSTAIGLLIFCGAVGKSGQVPLHVWLPDAMEGPTPVSALIHAATMVAAGVYLVARVYPLMSGHALEAVAWVGAITAFFAACIAVAQNDIKRILAYSTVSQLGYMMLGLGVGGVAVGMFHLITHAFFKALLFLGAGSVIHGCTEEQDIRNMGGLRRYMPITFLTYAAGMLALCGSPLRRVLEQGRNPRRGPRLGRFARTVYPRRRWSAAHRVLYDAPGLLRFLRPAPHAGSRSCSRTDRHARLQRPCHRARGFAAAWRSVRHRRSAREPGRHDVAADPPRHLCDVPRLRRHPRMAVVSGFPQWTGRCI